MARRAPFVFEACVILALGVGFVLGGAAGLLAETGCATAPPIVADALTVEGRVAVCMLENVGQPDETIVSRCSPASSQPTQAEQTIRVVLALCHAEKARDAGTDREEGNLWTTRSRRLASSSRVWPARLP